MNEPANLPFEGRSNQIARVWHIGICIALGFAVLLGTLAWHQLVNREKYVEKQAFQIYRRVVKEGARGSIYDRNGVLLAGNQPLFSVGVYLNELRTEFRLRYRELQEQHRTSDRSQEGLSLSWQARHEVMQEKMDEVGRIIGRDLNLDQTTFENHFKRRRILPFQICTDLNRDEYAKLVEHLPPDSPLQILSEPVRYYPFGNVASHVIGYVGLGESENIQVNFGDLKEIRTLNLKRHEGKSGLEKSLDAQLRAGIGWEVWSIDPLGFQFDRIDAVEPPQGSDLHTTLDIDLQLVGEASMDGKTGAMAVIRVDSGEVLALVSKPNYDLNLFTPSLSQAHFDAISEQGAWLNRATQGLYPPGSTFKVVTALAALSDPTFNPNQEVYCGPFYTVGDRRFPENRSRGHGYINLVDSLAVSSNVYFYQLGLREGIARIARQSRLLGLGAPTGVELPFESGRTLVPDREWKEQAGRGVWLRGDTANVSIGQGDLLVTPLQMARLTAAIAKRREYLPVTLLRDKNTSFFTASRLGIEDSRFDYVIEGMRRCVIRGTGKSMQLPDIPLAAKTGTAQVFPGGKEENLAWVIAFAPVENPQIAVAVVVEDVGSSDPIYGGSTAGPIASTVIQEYFNKYGLP
ncbi:MAG: penicillin-binding transpeptidase domain-containing protein [Puniceicoccaceae bacterium]